jgi:Zn finger protein HypA/HybF involved in hydrogenase expression
MTAPLGRCPACGEPTLRMVAGTELKIKEMETESCV